jgi:hypothetical protein
MNLKMMSTDNKSWRLLNKSDGNSSVTVKKLSQAEIDELFKNVEPYAKKPSWEHGIQSKKILVK